MRHRRLIASTTVVVSLCWTAITIGTDGASAAPGSENPTTTVAPPATIVAGTGTPDVPVGGGGGGSGGGTGTPVVIPCRWDDVRTTQTEVDAFNVASQIIQDFVAPIVLNFTYTAFTYYERFGVLHKAGDAPGEWLKAQRADCSAATDPGGVDDGDWRWVISVPPDPADLLPGTNRTVTEIVEPPIAAINPAGPGYVRLGMWLAIEPAGPYVARAQIPPSGPAAVWAETTATVADTTFVFGTGESIRCDGFGTPIPDSALDAVGQGPCGHTFTEFTGDTSVTITTRWSVTWELSDGRTGSEADLFVSTVVPYEVLEIQTVGVADGRG